MSSVKVPKNSGSFPVNRLSDAHLKKGKIESKNKATDFNNQTVSKRLFSFVQDL